MRLFFNFTGVHDTTDNFANIAFLDAGGNPIPGLTGQFDDINVLAGVVQVNFEIFGPVTFLHGFTLGPSDGSGVTTMELTRAADIGTLLRQASY